jgi:hypothetical protein
VFTTKRKAVVYRNAHLSPEWELLTVPRDDLASMVGMEDKLVVNPSHDGKDGRLLTGFQVLVDLC